MIAPNDDIGAALTQLNAAHAALLDQAGSQCYRLTAQWIDALVAVQQAGMTSIRCRDRLYSAQLRLQQLLAMRDALRADPGSHVGNGHQTDQ